VSGKLYALSVLHLREEHPTLSIEERVGWAPFILGFLIIFVSILVLRLCSLHLM
jgi:hypothetical protein